MIGVSKITWHEVSDKIDTEPIQEVLNTIDLSKYGEGVKSISFNFIAVQPSGDIHENEVSFNSEEKGLQAALKLNYNHLEEASTEHVLQMMTNLFVASIDLYEELEIADFNQVLFKEDIEQLFRKKDWIE